MKIHDLFEVDTSISAYELPIVLDDDVVCEHFDALRGIHEQLGLDTRGRQPSCPGLSEDGLEFQAQLEATPLGEEVGSHILVYDAEETSINEVNLMGWAGLIDLSSGRMRTPEKRYLTDYQLTSSGLTLITRFIIERARTDAFEPVTAKQLLSLPQ